MPRRSGIRGSTFWRGKSVVVSFPLPAHLDERNAAGKRLYKKIIETYPDEQTALDRLIALNHQYRTGTLAAPDHQLLGDYLDEWLATKDTLAVNTQVHYRRDCEIIKQGIGHIELRNIDTLILQRWHADMASDPSITTYRAHHAHSRLSQALKAAVNAGRIPHNAASRLSAPRHDNQRHDAWEPHDATRFVRAITDPETMRPYRVLGASYWLVMLNTGLRVSEALALRWSDLDLERARLTVERTGALIEGGVYGIKDRPKTNAALRTIPLPARVIAALRARRADQNQQRLRMGRHWVDDNLVWTREDGRHIIPSTARNQLTSIIRAAGLPRITPHGLRHTAASLMLERGVPVTTVQEILGHDDPATTLAIYSHASTASKQEAIEGLDRLLNG